MRLKTVRACERPRAGRVDLQPNANLMIGQSIPIKTEERATRAAVGDGPGWRCGAGTGSVAKHSGAGGFATITDVCITQTALLQAKVATATAYRDMLVAALAFATGTLTNRYAVSRF
ncbi:hypothetical protein [Ensifer adhaerens]|uniref:hypothetical protein n=1 Tax=Ensifer adhaerens TaxID=106592 RepID=UPI00080731B8|nr:hypothetical protein [Ensifer adhaerens]